MFPLDNLEGFVLFVLTARRKISFTIYLSPGSYKLSERFLRGKVILGLLIIQERYVLYFKPMSFFILPPIFYSNIEDNMNHTESLRLQKVPLECCLK